MDRIENKLSGDPSAMVLGIIGLVVIFVGCCCGLFTAVSLSVNIVGLVIANKSLREYANDPENYSVGSYKNVNTARILNIIGIAVSGLVLLGQIAFLVINGGAITDTIYDEWRKNGRIEYEYDSESDSTDTGTWDDQTIQLKKQGDSIVIDTVAAETQQ